MTFGEQRGATCPKCFAFVGGADGRGLVPSHVCMEPTAPASLLHERDVAIEILEQEVAALERERDLLVVVARRAQGLLAALDEYDAGARVKRRQLREALDAWGRDESEGGGNV